MWIDLLIILLMFVLLGAWALSMEAVERWLGLKRWQTALLCVGYILAVRVIFRHVLASTVGEAIMLGLATVPAVVSALTYRKRARRTAEERQRQALAELHHVEDLEHQHREGYAREPVKPGEFDV